ncbi:Uu.00g094340.m01.CDS01 [Anthostomella pinea]|uniref:Uu.00g094340.m01.CDS01 n=1 Tax=Anthostomella pinea TaxID=933095 RepID=A0AAI8VNQ3_9PEZI|nr:Uu.00g094340.m01.CDS01 [Anthostomella pinea]
MDRSQGVPQAKPCMYFQRDTCKFVSKCKNRHVKLSGPCPHLPRGKCKFGSECFFSHESLPSPPNSQEPTRHKAEGGERKPANAPLNELKQLVGQISSRSHTSSSSTYTKQQQGDRFFQLVLVSIGGDPEDSQETIKLMAKEEGFGFIRSLVDHRILGETGSNQRNRVELWLKQVRPIFQVLTHPCVLNSDILEQQVAEIYNFILGVGDKRIKTLFDFVLGLLDAWSTLPMAKDDEYGIVACELSLSVLATMNGCNTNNIFSPTFRHIVERLEDIKYLNYLHQRLGEGDAIPQTGVEQINPVTRSEFVMRRDLPGQLSAEGPRHDNDHADICDISIFPTHAEIFSTRSEYLPTTDSSLFHKPGIHGRLDRAFRLLREDTLGQIRDALRTRLGTGRNPDSNQNRGNRNASRIYVYEQAAVNDVDFDENRGMDLLIRFRQLVSNRTTQERQDWWANPDRFQPGNLVCMVDEEGSFSFCLVAHSTIVIHEEKEKRKGGAGRGSEEG